MTLLARLFIIMLLFTTGCEAEPIRSPLADFAVIDRDRGMELETHFYHGEFWVAGRPGARYAIEIRNHSDGRLLAVTSVDGINVLSGQTAAWNQEGYVFEPAEGYRITGWRKSPDEVAAFTFSAEPNSYAARTGRAANVGVIGIALFRERQAVRAYAPPDAAEARAKSQALEALPKADVESGAPVADRRLGTGHGEREFSAVAQTEFRRRQPTPDAVLRVRYDSLENLIAMGVVPRPGPRTPDLEPFPGSRTGRYVPDPPGW